MVSNCGYYASKACKSCKFYIEISCIKQLKDDKIWNV